MYASMSAISARIVATQMAMSRLLTVSVNRARVSFVMLFRIMGSARPALPDELGVVEAIGDQLALSFGGFADGVS